MSDHISEHRGPAKLTHIINEHPSNKHKCCPKREKSRGSVLSGEALRGDGSEAECNQNRKSWGGKQWTQNIEGGGGKRLQELVFQHFLNQEHCDQDTIIMFTAIHNPGAGVGVCRLTGPWNVPYWPTPFSKTFKALCEQNNKQRETLVMAPCSSIRWC